MFSGSMLEASENLSVFRAAASKASVHLSEQISHGFALTNHLMEQSPVFILSIKSGLSFRLYRTPRIF
ncbi:hypothetical protein FR483_n167R [Paramecium bursaria Chlorella virus FR483]|uniref:Uncharacterized protein n167R n=1 Tax=Paramecium bursaria Chlorella virus FR483 TaxID=399781 RepID=A7J6M1_PBCVF|nr:hypothetical protein FR483_n167R [Paramecium bursaria Chlorella virus FR483]ABT15452.1 hypothetical protein FR483_n167R [Paramecium bursaria Chlorella virus FR483]